MNPQPKLYGLIGNPLGHSFSQDYFTKFFASNHIDAEYRNFELSDIGEVMELVAEYPQLCGFNITSPYKQQILPYIDHLSGAAAQIGAVNVVKILREGDDLLFEGHNTDAAGFSADIAPLVKAGAKALVLGSGGAASAVTFGLKSIGVEPLIVSRKPADGVITYADLSSDLMAGVSVIINATPLGMGAHKEEMPEIPYDLIRPDMLCYDLIYNPCPTLFMAQCARRGAAVKGGLGMLINQAVLSWKIWNNQ